jgi:hypothetical protein
MSTDFETVEEDLEAFLKSSVPETWRVQDASNTAGNTTGIVLSYLLVSISNKNQGVQLNRDYLTADFLLEISAPEKDLVKSQRTLMPILPILFRALDDHPSLTWDDAIRGTTQSGQTIYSVPVSVFVSTTDSQE